MAKPSGNELANRTFDLTSCGRAFALTEHSLYGPEALASGANRFVVLRVTHEAANNLGSQAAQILLATDIGQGSCRNQFQAVPATARLVPPPVDRPTAPGMQTATVVAAEGEPLTTDRDGRDLPPPNAEHAYYMLPAGVTLYWDGDMPEGFSRYKVYFNVEGQRLVEREQKVPGAITPATLQPIYKEELLDLLKLMKLSAADISAIIAGAQFTDEDRQQVRAVLDASQGTDGR